MRQLCEYFIQGTRRFLQPHGNLVSPAKYRHPRHCQNMAVAEKKRRECDSSFGYKDLDRIKHRAANGYSSFIEDG